MTTMPVNKCNDGKFLLYRQGATIFIMEHFIVEFKSKEVLIIFDKHAQT
jgi:hypothetical protein